LGIRRGRSQKNKKLARGASIPSPPRRRIRLIDIFREEEYHFAYTHHRSLITGRRKNKKDVEENQGVEFLNFLRTSPSALPPPHGYLGVHQDYIRKENLNGF